MLRIMNSIKFLSLETVTNSTVNLNIVRWRRKPRKPMWKGTAKSKIFRVPPRPVIPVEEHIEIQRLYNKYRTEMKTIKQFLAMKYNVQNLQQDDQDAKRKEFEADLEACMKLNDSWNAEQKVKREARVKQEVQANIEAALKRKSETTERRQQRLKEHEEEVRKQKECSKSFILPEMLDDAIEHAIKNPVDHNFALEIDGNKIIGRETSSTQEQKSVRA